MPMFCKNCGATTKTKNKFCSNCGQKIKINRAAIFGAYFLEWIRDHKKQFLTLAGVIVFIGLIWTYGQLNHQIAVPDDIFTQTISYDQSEITASVVNILCPSTDSSEEGSGGSGTIITDDGLILTNSHIIPQDATYLHVGDEGCLVFLPDPETGQPSGTYLAHPIVLPELSDKYDLAFMDVYSVYYDEDTGEYDGTYPRKFPSFDDTSRCKNNYVKLGEPVRIFGYPSISGGYSLTITDGVVSSFPGEGMIITSAKISHGNSGGLAVDKNGCMIGVPSMVSFDEAESLGVIISMDLVNQFVDEVITYVNN